MVVLAWVSLSGEGDQLQEERKLCIGLNIFFLKSPLSIFLYICKYILSSSLSHPLSLLFSSKGMYHWGVVKCLYENHLLPTVLCGSSIGALVVALLGVTSDEALGNLLSDPQSISFEAFERLKEV